MVQSAGFQGTNRIQLKNPDISGAILILSLSILKLNSQCVEGARDVRILLIDPDYFVEYMKISIFGFAAITNRFLFEIRYCYHLHLHFCISNFGLIFAEI